MPGLFYPPPPPNSERQSLTGPRPRSLCRLALLGLLCCWGLIPAQHASAQITISGDTTGSVTEDEVLTATGTLTIDNRNPGGNTDFVALTDERDSGLGSFSITAEGVWTYTLFNDILFVQLRQRGFFFPEFFTVTAAADPTVTETVVIRFNATNDAPVATINAPTEGAQFSVGETVTLDGMGTDVDAGDTLTFAWSANPNVGTFVHNDPSSPDATWTLSAIPPTGGEVTLTLTVTDDEAAANDTATVTVRVVPVSTDATLSALTLFDGIILSPVFDSGTLAYRATVANAVASLTVTPTASDDGATITVDGDAVSSGMASGAIALSTGANPIPVVVTAEDRSTIMTYMITVTRLLLITISGLRTGGVTEDGILTVSGTVAIENLDPSGNTDFVPLMDVRRSPVNYGSFSITAEGRWTYTLDNNREIVQALRERAFIVERFFVTAAAAPSVRSFVNISIEGNNDAPVASISMPTAGTQLSVGEPVTLVGRGTDVDIGDTLTFAWSANPNVGTFVHNDISSPDATWTPPDIPPTGSEVILTLTVTDDGGAFDGTATATAMVTIRVVSNDATLSALTLSDGTLTPDFDSGTQTYTATVANAVDSLTVTPTVSHTGATITVADTDVGSGTPSGEIPLNVGDNPIPVEVTAGDGSMMLTYTITVIRVAAPTATISVTNLASLTEANLDGATLMVTLMNTEYQALLTPGQFTLSSAPRGVTVASVSRTDATNAVLTLAFDGTNFDVDATLGVTVAAAAHTVTGNLPTATVPVTAVLESNDASLSGLVLSDGIILSPAFARGTMAYTATVVNAVASLMLTPTASDDGATITVAGTDVGSGTLSGEIPLNIGDNSILVEVTAEDGSTIMIYTITVTRGAAAGLSLVTVTADPAAITEDGPAATLTLTVEPTSSSALTLPYTITGPGVTDTDYVLAADTATLPSAGMVQLPANTGSATLTLTAVDDSVAELAETLSFTLGDASDNYDLGDPSSADVGIAQNGTPAVSITADPATIDEGGASTLTLTVTPAGWATPLIVGYGVSGAGVSDADYGLAVAATGGNGAILSTGTLSGTVTIPAAIASGTVALTLTAVEDGATEGEETLSVTLNAGTGYTLAGPAAAITINDTSVAASTDATLNALALSEGTLSPPFASGTTTYRATVANAVASLTVTPTASDAGATITVADTLVRSSTPSEAIELIVGPNPIMVEVTAEAGNTQTYTITVTREALPITISGTHIGQVTEDGVLTATGTLSIDNPNPGGSKEFVPMPVTQIGVGSFGITAQGVWTYTLDNDDTSVQALGSNAFFSTGFTATAAADPSVTQNIAISITGTNDTPVARIIAPTAGAQLSLGETVTLDGMGTDVDIGNILTYAWSANPDVGNFNHADSARADATWTAPNMSGNVTLTLTVTDDRSAADTAMVTVQVGQPDLLDLNRDNQIQAQDAQILYYLLLPSDVSPPMNTNLRALLNNLRSADTLNQLRAQRPDLDLNGNGEIDRQDARILYYVARFEALLRASTSLRDALLGDLVNDPDAALNDAGNLLNPPSP